MSTGHPALITPYSTSDLVNLVNELRGHHSAMHGQGTDVAAALRGVLPDVIAQRGGTRRGLMGMDARMAARMVVKPLMDAAALNQKQAKLYVLFHRRYTEMVVNVNIAGRPSGFKVEG